MLTQNFLSPVELGISDKELDALVRLLGAMERGEIKDAPVKGESTGDPLDDGLLKGLDFFDMNYIAIGSECGTVGCMLGWARYLSKDTNLLADMDWVGDPLFYPGEHEHPNNGYNATVEQSATVLRAFLTTGKVIWHKVCPL